MLKISESLRFSVVVREYKIASAVSVRSFSTEMKFLFELQLVNCFSPLSANPHKMVRHTQTIPFHRNWNSNKQLLSRNELASTKFIETLLCFWFPFIIIHASNFSNSMLLSFSFFIIFGQFGTNNINQLIFNLRVHCVFTWLLFSSAFLQYRRILTVLVS